MVIRPLTEKEGKNTEKKNVEELELTTSEGRIEQIRIVVSSYQSNNSLCVGMFSLEDGYPSPCGNLTIDLPGEVPEYCAYIDTDNIPESEDFLTKNAIAEFTGLEKKWGNVSYPLYLFEPERLRELCPEGMKKYDAEKGINQKQNEMNICR